MNTKYDFIPDHITNLISTLIYAHIKLPQTVPYSYAVRQFTRHSNLSGVVLSVFNIFSSAKTTQQT